MRKFGNRRRNVLHENVIHVGAGFVAKERPYLAETLSTLGPHLGRWDSRDVNVDVSLQDRGGKEQRVTLRTTLPGLPPLVAVAENPDITRALSDAKGALIRQIEHQKSMRKPMKNRRLGATIRHPGPTKVATLDAAFETQPTARLSGQIERQT
jgi:ribosome-associated translation inhibitor RaiA